MILFWVISAAMIAVGLAFLLPTLLQHGPAQTGDAKQRANVEVYRDQLSELDADVANGLVSTEQYQQDRDEIERRLLEDIAAGRSSAVKTEAAKPNRTTVYAVALGIPVAAIILYWLVGNPAALSGKVPQSAGQNGPMTQAGIEANVAALAKRLEQKPEDPDGWAMLGRSYLSLEKYKEAGDAYARAASLKPADPDLLTEQAFAVAMANGKQLQGQPMELIKKALQIAPENPKALELAGSAEFQAKNYDQAIAYWQKLLAKTTGDDELSRTVSQRIDEAKALRGDKAK
jgi:cytochrome c-type biogenesis protein CcmH